MAGGLTLSEEAIKRLVPTQFARSQFLRQRPLGAVETRALAEGTLRAEAAVKSQRIAQLQRVQVEKERIAESRRQSEAAAMQRRRERKAAEPSFIETLFGK